MNEEYDQLLHNLRAITVAVVTRVVAKNEHLISFRGKDGETVWDDEPDFDDELARFTAAEWNGAEKSYSHYFGFASFSVGDTERTAYFQKSCCASINCLGFGMGHNEVETLTPPKVNDWIAGEYRQAEKGYRFSKWTVVSKYEVWVRHSLLNGDKVREDDIAEMEKSESAALNRLAKFARLIANGDIEYFLAMKRNDATADEAVRYTHRYDIDRTVLGITKCLRPELWDRYKEASETERLYSSLIPKPAPKPIKDNLDGKPGVTVGLSTPFDGLATMEGLYLPDWAKS